MSCLLTFITWFYVTFYERINDDDEISPQLSQLSVHRLNSKIALSRVLSGVSRLMHTVQVQVQVQVQVWRTHWRDLVGSVDRRDLADTGNFRSPHRSWHWPHSCTEAGTRLRKIPPNNLMNNANLTLKGVNRSWWQVIACWSGDRPAK